ncbi:MAG: precorrin-6y C5,15-methyltransferase (decarboxylating) subunit CbiE, partial [Deltaproteobacteria bacterium]|nr:precorrin-6y C5,15-methyltransferase (decarboxylating) subunit CbiE [Deltaproteobacteria bacterium]
RHLGWFDDHPAQKHAVGKNAAELVALLKKSVRGKRVVVLASGDPHFYGIAALFYSAFDKKIITVIPAATAFQWAFARMKQPWEDVHFISVHGRSLSALDAVLRRSGTTVIYCDAVHSPGRVAEYLLGKDKDLGRCETWVCDSLGSGTEKIVSGTLSRIRPQAFSALCMMVIKHERRIECYSSGIADELFVHQRGLITKRDVRMLAIVRLGLHDQHVLWDIGAGSGSLAIEAANLNPTLKVFALEQDRLRCAQMRKNISRFKTYTVEAVCGAAPAALKGLPDPDAVFVGGTGGGSEAILRVIKKRLAAGGHVVVNCVTMETLSRVRSLLSAWKWPYDMTSVQLSHLTSEKEPEIFRAVNPVFIVHARAPGA